MDPRRTPEGVGAAHPPNQLSELRPHRGATPSASTLPRPVTPEPLPVPPHHGLRPHHLQGTPPTLPEPGQHDPEDPVHYPQPCPRPSIFPLREFLPMRVVFHLHLAMLLTSGLQCS